MSHDKDSETRVTPEVVEAVEVGRARSLAVPVAVSVNSIAVSETAQAVVAKLPSTEGAGEVVSAREAGAGRVTEIAYCPHLGIYHYRRADGDEFMFDEVGLEQAVEAYIKQADTRQAEFMASLTAFARQFPHQVVSFDADGNLNLRELLAREHQGEESADEVLAREQQGGAGSGAEKK